MIANRSDGCYLLSTGVFTPVCGGYVLIMGGAGLHQTADLPPPLFGVVGDP